MAETLNASAKDYTGGSGEESARAGPLGQTLDSPGTQRGGASRGGSPLVGASLKKPDMYIYRDKDTQKYVVKHPEAGSL